MFLTNRQVLALLLASSSLRVDGGDVMVSAEPFVLVASVLGCRDGGMYLKTSATSTLRSFLNGDSINTSSPDRMVTLKSPPPSEFFLAAAPKEDHCRRRVVVVWSSLLCFGSNGASWFEC